MNERKRSLFAPQKYAEQIYIRVKNEPDTRYTPPGIPPRTRDQSNFMIRIYPIVLLFPRRPLTYRNPTPDFSFQLAFRSFAVLISVPRRFCLFFFFVVRARSNYITLRVYYCASSFSVPLPLPLIGDIRRSFFCAPDKVCTFFFRCAVQVKLKTTCWIV